jgi:hypothetical protein
VGDIFYTIFTHCHPYDKKDDEEMMFSPVQSVSIIDMVRKQCIIAIVRQSLLIFLNGVLKIIAATVQDIVIEFNRILPCYNKSSTVYFSPAKVPCKSDLF